MGPTSTTQFFARHIITIWLFNNLKQLSFHINHGKAFRYSSLNDKKIETPAQVNHMQGIAVDT